MGYSVKCECGRALEVRAGDAGSRVTCECSRAVEVPSLHVLRRTAGEAPVSAEMMINLLLKDGKLPQETECVGCGMPTGHICFAHVDCEQATLRKPGWTINPLGLLIGWLMFERAEGETRVIGKNLAYTLPVRVCGECAAGLTDGRIRLLVEKVPLYAQLLAKWPRAKVSVNVR